MWLELATFHQGAITLGEALPLAEGALFVEGNSEKRPSESLAAKTLGGIQSAQWRSHTGLS